MKLIVCSMIAFCFLCHHHLFHRHASACGVCASAAVVAAPVVVAQPVYAAPAVVAAPVYQQSFAVAAPVYAQSFAVAQPVYAQAFAAPVCSSFAVGGGHGRGRSVSRSFSRTVVHN